MNASTVRIAVNDVSAASASVSLASADDDLLIPLRSVRSLSRLDVVLRADKRAAAAAADDAASACEMFVAGGTGHLAYKCTSFPRIDRYSSVDELRLALTDADSMSPRLSNATLSQDLDGELLTLSVNSLSVPPAASQQTTRRSFDTTLTRSTSARTIAPASGSTTGAVTLSNLLSPPVNLAAITAKTSSAHRRFTRSTSCPSMSSPVQLSPSPSSLLQPFTLSTSTRCHVGRLPGGAETTTTKSGKGRPQFDSDVDLDSEHVNDLPVIAAGSDFPDFLPNQSTGMEVGRDGQPVSGVRLTVEQLRKSTSQRCDTDARLLKYVGSYRSCRLQRAPELVQIKCLQWLSSLDHAADM